MKRKLQIFATALDGSGLAQGDVTTLTWSYVPDGTPIGNGGCGVSGESTDDSNIISFFNNIYGSPTTPGDYTTAPWHQIFINMFDSWSNVNGLVFVYEPNDDGASVVTGGNGVSGVRGDFRISGHALDGNSGVLACNYFPNNGDMIIDTSDNYFSNNPGIGTTNVLTHEIGHGLGIAHVCPVNETKLMEPFVTTAFQGPQEDDVLATNRSYGDPDGDNDTSVNATFLGNDSNPVIYIKQQRSIDDDTELDYYSFTVTETSSLTATLTPTGSTYLDDTQNPDGSCNPGTNFNALTVSDLMFEVIDADGISVVATADSNGPGVEESLIASISASGTYFIKVQQQGTAVDNVQMYDLELSLEAGSCTTASIPTNLQVSSITDTSASINWDAQSGTLYDLRYRESGITPWTDITDLVASNTTLTGLTESTEYEVQIRSKCPGDTPTAYSSSIFFTTDDTILVYCDSEGSIQQDEYIGNVQFASIDNTSADENGGYSDFTGISTPVVAGENYSISITPIWTGTIYNEGYAVWIDYNQNGSFADIGEFVFSQSPTSIAPVTGNIAIPNTASEGTTRMRVSMKWDDIPDPCESFTYGEVEDYTVKIYKGYIYTNDSWSPNQPITGSVPSTISDDITIIDGNALISEELVGNNLKLEPGSTLEFMPSASSTNTVLNLDGNIINDGTILFKSDADDTAQFDEFTGNISGFGEVTVERYIPAKRAYRLLASPVTTTDFIFENWQESGSSPATPDGLGTHITGGDASLGFDQSGSNSPSMFTFDNANQSWQALPNTDATRLNVQEPYLIMVRGDRSIDLTDNSSLPTETTLSARGDLFTGSSSPALSTGLGFYSLIANPYQAVVDFSLATRTDLTDFIYIWDASIAGDNGRGGYVSVDVTGNTTPPNPFSSDASKFIAPGMSFFVQNLSSGPVSPSLTFDEDDKATGANQVTVFNTYPHFYINSRLYLSSDLQNGNSERDAIGLRFSDNFTTLGSDEDATKLGNPDENYAVVNNGLRSIDKQAVPSIGHEIDFSITNYTETNYSLTFVMENKPEDLGVFLKDEYLGTQTELTESFVYDFSIDQNIPESIVESRFSLVFDNTTLGVNDNAFGDNFSLYPNPTSNGLFSIKTPNLSGKVDVEITNLLGQQVYKQELSVESQKVNVNAKHLSTGVYLVKLSQSDESYSAKLMVE